MGVSIEKVQWFGRRRWPWDQYNILQNNRAQLKTKRRTKLTYPVTDFIPFLNNQRLKRQNQNQLLTLFLSWRINDSNARIRISTEELKVNTQQVLAVSDRTEKHLATRLGLCSRSGLPVRAEPASTCWVFTLNSFVLILILAFESLILQESNNDSNWFWFRRLSCWFLKKGIKSVTG